ncbi:D-tyrosyl-tRNA(Tyr) deacylase [Lacticaseibacillus pantheris DSM 15945 = JCM 12539 = NBRC 106106]|uniref:D-aminoacyl-tRNA deacylase n=1 Tax=Lacticaseibacillus pantheris DSM 15945 = JCM 12539 = NBRC 106106 TaxID=1423783 RepID=A0A0R1U2E1_9LACO|nr:D-aminoacyl-tRNA deacylase [Lacticaseibacillus pantheris]KRL85400.1 D-tyrosyl-tRNA(Tyr) deacylase [Lacticaseibacillus pantheris DSM 15945 = JCM 12539 = NBRC 106106]
MRIIAQRVSNASVAIAGKVVGAIDGGYMVLVGVGPNDAPEEADKLAQKLVKLRVFSDDAGKMNRSLLDVGGAVLSISQFTLYADLKKGNRPSFTGAAGPELGRALYEHFNAELARLGVTVATGEFGADMQVTLTNDGPVTMTMDTEAM